ncbi:hypothetical protein HDA32_001039 [Spinactinospora alkalitolerans]|uniref:Cyclic nucleotide-binding domain-containing protein n=1 Tax=Spinactinospora alkalitolerans TaxID=687207 RepID=A0A852TPK0_9ACTN|nr:hypothetical protein [Spinactinospora alkalitolerans]NYE45919.1 hypothetical protein [Spinactinospora alkalitolerans]
MQRCADCETPSVAEYLVEPGNEHVWVCRECDALWLEGHDRDGPSFMDLARYLAEVGREPWDLVLLRSDAPLSPLHEAWPALRALIGEGRLSALRVGALAAEARDVVGPWGPGVPPLNAAQVVPSEPGPVRMRLSGGVVTELVVEITGGRLELPGVLDGDTGPDFTVLSRANVESVLRQARAAVRPRPEGVTFDTGRFRGELDFEGERLRAVRVRACG